MAPLLADIGVYAGELASRVILLHLDCTFKNSSGIHFTKTQSSTKKNKVKKIKLSSMEENQLISTTN